MNSMFPRGPIRVRPGRRASLISAVMGVGMLFFFAGSGAPGFFILAVLAVIGLSLFNAFDKQGIPEWEIETSDDAAPSPPPAPPPPAPVKAAAFCTACGHALDGDDRFCGGCGAAVERR